MEYILISAAALVVSGLTFFSGFGLGTLLMPFFAIFFPVEVAVAATAIVHLANNIFKVILVGRDADKNIAIKFAVPAAFGALIGAWLLGFFSELQPIVSYQLSNKSFSVMPVKVIIAILMIIFALVELLPALSKYSFKKEQIPFGGFISGFFGGLSGHQGALRTAFLLRSGLEKKSFIGTMVVSAVAVDVVRLIVYGSTFLIKDITVFQQSGMQTLLLAGTLSAFVGSYAGKYLFEKVTSKSIQVIVAVMLLTMGLALGFGVV